MDWKIASLGFLLVLWLCTGRVNADTLDITFIDVGEGEAILLESGGHSALVDTGNPMTGSRVVELLNSKNIKRLDMLLISHPHPDHMGGVFQLLAQVDVERRYDNGQDLSQSRDFLRWYKEYFRTGNYGILEHRDELKLGEARILVLNSLNPGESSMNQNSLVLLITHGKTRILLMGDAGAQVESRILKDRVDLRVDLLKVGHHGAADGTSPKFLEAVAPAFAVISINKDNFRGYPSSEVIDRLKQAGATMMTTYEKGDISFRSDGKTLRRQ